jgi:hypothetical protein
MATQDVRGIRRSALSSVGGVQAQFNSNEYDAQLVAQEMPSYAEMTRLGQGWSAMAVLAVAALVIRPTTTAAFEVWNGNVAGGASLIITRLFSHELVHSTTGLGGAANIWAAVTAPKTAPSAGANVVVRGSSGKAYGGAVVCGLGTTVVDSGWFPWGPANHVESAGAVVPAGAMWVRVDGELIVPPQCSLALHVVSGYVADTFCSGAGWYERTISTL